MKHSNILSIVLSVVLIVFAVSCNKNGETAVSIEGTWELVNYETKSVVIGEQTVVVFVDFKADKSFDIFQKTGSEKRFTKFSGSWSVTGGKLSGVYSDGSPLASTYSVSVSGDSMTLTSDSVPSEIMMFNKAPLPAGI